MWATSSTTRDKRLIVPHAAERSFVARGMIFWNTIWTVISAFADKRFRAISQPKALHLSHDAAEFAPSGSRASSSHPGEKVNYVFYKEILYH
jgi:hypothetical protein